MTRRAAGVERSCEAVRRALTSVSSVGFWDSRERGWEDGIRRRRQKTDGRRESLE